MTTIVRIACAALAAALLVGCSSQQKDRSGLFEPYKVDLPQGNYITGEMLEQIRAGLTRDQVRSVLGRPLLNPMFRTDRWDYVFRYQHASGAVDLRRVVVIFKDDRVERVDADALPKRETPDDPALPGYRPTPTPAPQPANG